MVSQGQRFASLAEAKAVATLAIAVEQSKNAVGDYARTQAGAANVARLAKEKFKGLAESFGKLLLPIQIKINKSLIAMSDRLSALSPRVKKVILIVGGIVAVMGPLLLIIGSIGLALPVLAMGFAAVGTALAFLTGPIGIIIALTVALGVFLAKSKTIRAFFSGIGLGIKESLGPTLAIIVADMKAAAKVIAEIFGSDSAANNAIDGTSENLMAFANAGRMVGNIVGGVLDGIITSLRIMGDLIGQLAGVVATADFSAFDFSSVTDKFKGFAARVGLIDDIESPVAPVAASPAVATANARATVNGQITVSASEGSNVDSVESQQSFQGSQGNVGIGVAG